MHDVFEGWAVRVLRLVLCQFIFVDRFFSHDFYVDTIASFEYNLGDASSKPVPWSKERLKNIHSSVGMSASQFWCLLRNFPLMFGATVPEEDKFWDFLTDFLSLVDRLTCRHIAPDEVPHLRFLIGIHLTLFLECFPNEKISPKGHFLTHYPSFILKFGPPISFWAMRGEAKHKRIKGFMKVSSNFRNVCLSVALKHQRNIALKYFIDDKTITKTSLIIKGGNLVKFSTLGVASAYCQQNDDVNVIQSVSVGGDVFIANYFVAYGEGNTHHPLFGKISSVFLFNSKTFVCLNTGFRVLGMDHHFNSFVIQTAEPFLLVLPLSEIYFRHSLKSYLHPTFKQLLLLKPKTHICCDRVAM